LWVKATQYVSLVWAQDENPETRNSRTILEIVFMGTVV
jgi:hypothetical protein